jgi:hypothetical protein
MLRVPRSLALTRQQDQLALAAEAGFVQSQHDRDKN